MRRPTPPPRPAPLVLTLLLDSHTSSHLTKLRNRYFPRHRNHLSAHLTLFHALPSPSVQLIKSDLSHFCRVNEPFRVPVGPPFKMGNRGVGVRLGGERIGSVHERLLKRWRDQGFELTNQDKMKLARPHVTIQNKVEESEAEAAFEEVMSDWEDFEGTALGFSLWEYQTSGAWEHVEDFLFGRDGASLDKPPR